MRVGVALGSNLGDRLRNLQHARAAIQALPDVASPFLASSVFITAPVDCEKDAGDFLNAVIEFDYHGNAQHLLKELRQIEASLGRPTRHARNQSRTIDLDLLYAGDMQISDKHLEIPHPRMAGREFVLQPLAQIRPEMILPGGTAPVSELLAALPKTDRLRALTNDW